MKLPPEHAKEFAQFPAPLRALVEQELAAGNQIAELSHGFPAAPCGAYIMLARTVTSRPRVKTSELDFYERNGSNHSGEFTDAKRHFFVLEPPRPPEPEPSMDDIRAKLEASATAARSVATSSKPSANDSDQASPSEREIRRRAATKSNPLVDRFVRSMNIDYEKWREGIGYEVELIKEASAEDFAAIEDVMLHRPCSDWRDVEALAALGTKRAKEILKQAHQDGNAEVRLAVHRHAPELLTEAERVASLVQALETAELFSGLSRAMDEVVRFHPPVIVDALLRGLITREGGVACHFAARLYYLHGKATSAFDWSQRPFFLKFNTPDLAEREIVVRTLCRELDIDPARCFAPKRN